MGEERRAVRASRLPRELHESDLSLIFAKLPVPVLWQARATCRVWRNAASADKRMAEVLKRRQSSSGRSLFVQVLHRGMGPNVSDDLRSLKYALAHDPVRNAWCPTLMFWHWGFHIARRREVAFEGTAGGLVFFHNGSETLGDELQVFVTNPLTNKVKEIPVLRHPWSDDIQVRMVPAADGGYSLVAMTAMTAHWIRSSQRFRIRTTVFLLNHSCKGNWFHVAPFPKEILRGLGHVTLGPAVNGSVYCYDEEAGKYQFWRFNLKANKWSEVPVPAEMMQGIFSFKLVEHWGRLLMVASSGETTGPQTMEMKQLEGIKVWELSVVDSVIQRESSASAGDAEPTGRNFVETTYRWNMLAEMEQNFFKHLRRRFEDHDLVLDGCMMDPEAFHLVAVDHCIYISINGLCFPRGNAGRFKNLVLFDTLDRSWSWVTPPEIVLPSGYRSYGNAMSFVPRKTALP